MKSLTSRILFILTDIDRKGNTKPYAPLYLGVSGDKKSRKDSKKEDNEKRKNPLQTNRGSHQERTWEKK